MRRRWQVGGDVVMCFQMMVIIMMLILSRSLRISLAGGGEDLLVPQEHLLAVCRYIGVYSLRLCVQK